MKPHTEELPDLPFDPSSINDEQLMTLFSSYVSWINYLAVQLSEVEGELRLVENRYDLQKAQAWKNMAGTATDKRVTVEGHPDVAVAKNNVANIDKAVNLLKVELQNAERCANLMSRELSRRIGRENTQKREYKWNP